MSCFKKGRPCSWVWVVLFLAANLVGGEKNDPLDVYDEPGTNPPNPEQIESIVPVPQIQGIQADLIGEGPEYVENQPELEVETFTTEDGREGWKVKLERNLPLATPALANGKVYVGGGFGSYEFYALDAATGKPLWLFHCADDGPTAAVVYKKRVAFNTESCILYVLDAVTGEKIWGRWLGDPLMSQPAVSGERIVMAYPDQRGGHSLACMNLENGEVYWTRPIPGEVITAPVISNGKVYASSLEGSVHCFELEEGTQVFSRKHQATSAPWIWKGKIYASLRKDEERTVDGTKKTVTTEGQARLSGRGERDNARLWAKQDAEYLNVDRSSAYAAKQAELDAAVGFSSAPSAAKLGQSEANLGITSVSGVWAFQGSRPTIIQGVSYASMGDTLKALDAGTGKILWKRHLKVSSSPGGRPFSPPSYASGKLYLAAVSGEIICLDSSDGSELWRYDCGEPVRFQPAVAEGRVYWGTDEGTVYCIQAGDQSASGWFMWGGNPQHNLGAD